MSRKLGAYQTYMLISIAMAMFSSLSFTINLIYQVEIVGLNPLQLALVGTTLETTVFLMEIPTGIVADTISRRLSVIIGIFLYGVGFLSEGLFPFFATVLLAQVLWGTGATFLSGATAAWLTDEIGEKPAGSAFLRASQLSLIGTLFGVIGSVLLASYQLQWPIIAGGIGFLGLALFLWLTMPETGFTPTPKAERSSWRQMKQTVRLGGQVIRNRQVLITILLIVIVGGLFSEGYDRLFTPHVLDNFTLPPLGRFSIVGWFGLFRLLGIPLKWLVNGIAHKRLDTSNHQQMTRALLIVTLLLMGTVIVVAQSRLFGLLIIAHLIVGALRSVSYPLIMAWINQRLPSSVRATILSLAGQADAIGQMAGGPLLGTVATLRSLRLALTIGALLLLARLPFFGLAWRQEGEVVVDGNRPVAPIE